MALCFLWYRADGHLGGERYPRAYEGKIWSRHLTCKDDHFKWLIKWRGTRAQQARWFKRETVILVQRSYFPHVSHIYWQLFQGQIILTPMTPPQLWLKRQHLLSLDCSCSSILTIGNDDHRSNDHPSLSCLRWTPYLFKSQFLMKKLTRK